MEQHIYLVIKYIYYSILLNQYASFYSFVQGPRIFIRTALDEYATHGRVSHAGTKEGSRHLCSFDAGGGPRVGG
jgi:hypothetical protein